jgi:hypothetical protein
VAVTGWRCVCGTSDLRTLYCPYCGRTAPSWVPPPPPDYAIPPRGARFALDRRGRATALALALVLFGGVHALTVRTEAAANARQAAFEQTLRELQAFVADRRGGPFIGKVRSKLLGDKEFALALDGIDLDDPPSPAPETPRPGDEEPGLDDFAATMVGLGIADPGDDPDAEERALVSNGVYGFYDPARGRLYVRGPALNAFARMVLVHELTHAWQDQHFGLDAVYRGIDSTDEARAVTALVEGDATRIEEEWRASRGPAERAAIEAYEAGLGSEGEPSRAGRAIGTLRSFPYVAGRAFVGTLAARGGNPAVDAAFLAPPVSSEQVLHPAAYTGHENPEVVHSPNPGSDDVLDVEGLGEVGLAVVAGGGRVDAAALRAASGWGGDAYVTWRDAGQTCTTIAVVMDDPAARDRLLGALRGQHAARRTLHAVAPRGLDMTTCVEDP